MCITFIVRQYDTFKNIRFPNGGRFPVVRACITIGMYLKQ